jgi:hypothetical protein
VARSAAAFHLGQVGRNWASWKWSFTVLRDARDPAPDDRRSGIADLPMRSPLCVPEGHYDLAATLTVRTITLSSDGDGELSVVEALETVALGEGRAIGHAFHPSAETPPIEQLYGLLPDLGYGPKIEEKTFTLSNCPFHGLVEDHRTLASGMNVSLMKGIVETARIKDAWARLGPAPGRCCVTLAS